MWACSTTIPFKTFAASYGASIFLDGVWHFYHEKEDISLSVAGICYMVGTLPFVYRFFRGSASTRTKGVGALLYAINFYTFGDPKDIEAPYFLHKHLLNHIGSTLFFGLACMGNNQIASTGGSGGKKGN